MVRFRRRRPCTPSPPPPNYFRFRLSPDVSIAVGTMTRTPGEQNMGTPVELMVSHQAEPNQMSDYERLLGDAMKGDATLFPARIRSRPPGGSSSPCWAT